MNIRRLTWPNRITLLRIGLLFVLVFLVYNEFIWARLFAAFLAVVVIIMDWLDGFLARKLQESTALGSVLDIAGDRVVENVLWICLADMRLIGVWIPIVVISRGIFTDSIRNYVIKFGYTGFNEKTMMRSPLGRFLTGSPVMRTGYAVLKALAFGSLLLFSGLEKVNHFWPWLQRSWITYGFKAGSLVAVIAAAICLIRGIPVIVEGVRLIQEKEAPACAHHSAGH